MARVSGLIKFMAILSKKNSLPIQSYHPLNYLLKVPNYITMFKMYTSKDNLYISTQKQQKRQKANVCVFLFGILLV